MEDGLFARKHREGRNERTERGPHFPIVVLQLNHAVEVIDRLGVGNHISTKNCQTEDFVTNLLVIFFDLGDASRLDQIR